MPAVTSLATLPSYESFLSLVISFGKTKVKDIFALPVEGGHKRKQMATDRFDAKLNYQLATHSKRLFQLPAFGETRAN